MSASFARLLPRVDGALRELRPLDYPLPPGDIAVYTRERYAYLLRDFADHPEDLAKLARHAEVHRIHSHAKYEPDIYDKEWPYLELLWKRTVAGVDRQDPDAPNWLSNALWKLSLTSEGTSIASSV